MLKLIVKFFFAEAILKIIFLSILRIPGDFRSLVYYYGIKNSGIEVWDKMFGKFLNNTIASEKTKLLYGLSAIQEPWALER